MRRLGLMVWERDDGTEQGGSCVSRKKWSHLGSFWVTLGPEGLGYGLDLVCARMRAQ